MAEGFPGKLWDETFTAEVIDQPDQRGIPWRGVRLGSDVKREQLVGLRIEVDYLTVGNSNVLNLVCRVRNATTAKRRLDVGWLTFWQPDGAGEHNVLRSEDIQRKPTVWDSWSAARHWGAVVNPETGRCAILISPYPHVRLMDWGAAGGHLGWLSGVDIPPSGSVKRECYLVLCRDYAEAQRYTCLRKYV